MRRRSRRATAGGAGWHVVVATGASAWAAPRGDEFDAVMLQPIEERCIHTQTHIFHVRAKHASARLWQGPQEQRPPD